MRCVVGEPFAGEKKRVVENGRATEERQVQATGERHDQPCADEMRKQPGGACAHGTQKKRAPRRVPFYRSRLLDYRPRQELGRNFCGMLVVPPPQIHLFTPLPIMVADAAALPSMYGTSCRFLPLTRG